MIAYSCENMFCNGFFSFISQVEHAVFYYPSILNQKKKIPIFFIVENRGLLKDFYGDIKMTSSVVRINLENIEYYIPILLFKLDNIIYDYWIDSGIESSENCYYSELLETFFLSDYVHIFLFIDCKKNRFFKGIYYVLKNNMKEQMRHIHKIFLTANNNMSKFNILLLKHFIMSKIDKEELWRIFHGS